MACEKETQILDDAHIKLSELREEYRQLHDNQKRTLKMGEIYAQMAIVAKAYEDYKKCVYPRAGITLEYDAQKSSNQLKDSERIGNSFNSI